LTNLFVILMLASATSLDEILSFYCLCEIRMGVSLWQAK
jgi:hypothetical protein